MALGQEGASHPGRIPSSLLGTIYLMQKKNQTFINQLNKKLRGRTSGTWKKQVLFFMELEDWKSISTWDTHTSGVCCWGTQALSTALTSVRLCLRALLHCHWKAVPLVSEGHIGTVNSAFKIKLKFASLSILMPSLQPALLPRELSAKVC